MMHFIRRLLGWECCGEWTQWVQKEQDMIRPTSYELDGTLWIHHKTITITRRWQERKCTICGKMQQRELKQ